MRARLAVVLLLTVACLAWVLWGLNVSAAVDSVASFRWWMLGPIWALYLLAHALRAQRFRILLPTPLDYRASFSALSIGYLALHVFPFRLGELVRPYLVREQRQVPFGDSLAVVVIERILDVLMLLCMILATSWFVELPTKVEVWGRDVLGLAQQGAGVLGVAGLVGVAVIVALGPRALTLTDRLPGGAIFRRFREALVALARRPAVAAQSLGLSVVIWLLTLLAVQLQLLAFSGVPNGFLDALATWSVTLSGMTVLPTPGFFGGFEAACSAALQLLGALPSAAAPFAIVLHLTQFVFTVVLGGIFLAIEGLNLREVVARSREEGR
ncbi:hypothetical protein LBMAG42_43920 [Deltaproteobacteria bacterium]|nr:hypothetical protein LBMAG42_43920 [Deltaproteobacteria bacterium]